MDTQQRSLIWSLRANVSRQDALRAFAGYNLSSLYWRATRGQLRKMAVAYVPFCLYQVQFDAGKTRHDRFFALDRVEGSLDLLEFPQAPQSDQLVPVENRNGLAPSLDEARADSLVREKILRIIFQNGFFRLREPKLQVASMAEFCMPYWLGFYGIDGTLRFRVLDAVRRRWEGGKAVALFERWLTA